MSDSRTQSVCGERFNKHVNMVCNLEKGNSHMHHFEPVAEPASTGEPPELHIGKQAEFAVVKLKQFCDCGGDGCDFCEWAKLIVKLALKLAARPSEPSAPPQGQQPYHVPIMTMKEIMEAEISAPQPRTLVCSRCHAEVRCDGDFRLWKHSSGGLMCEDAEAVEPSAPSPTPSVSTPQFDAPMLIERLHRCVGIAEVEGAISEGEREHLDEFLNSLAKLAAPSVAGAQPTWIRQESCSECDGDGCAKCQTLKDRIADLLKLGSGDEDGPSEDAVFDYVKALAGAAQGIPQVEEIRCSNCQSPNVDVRYHFSMSGKDSVECRNCKHEEFRPHGVGAPAQPGPETFFCEQCKTDKPITEQYPNCTDSTICNLCAEEHISGKSL